MPWPLVLGGSVVPLVTVLKDERPSDARGLRRFSVLAATVVAVLAATGIALAVVLLEEPSALVDTAYGKVFIVKLALVLLLFGRAAIKRWLLTARSEAGDKRAARILVRTVAVEAMVILTIFGVAAAWRRTPPPRTFAAAATQRTSRTTATHLVIASYLLGCTSDLRLAIIGARCRQKRPMAAGLACLSPRA